MSLMSNKRNSGEMSVAAIDQIYGKSVARAARKKRGSLSMSGGERHPGWGSYVVLVVFILFFLFPFYYAISIASQDSPSKQYGVQALIPGGALFENVATAFREINFWQALGGTLFVATITSFSTVLFSTLAGFAFAKLRFRGRNGLLTAVIATMTIPQFPCIFWPPRPVSTALCGQWQSLRWSAHSECSG